MVTKAVLNPAGYAKLLKDIRRILQEGRTQAEEAAGREIIIAYWNIGKRLIEEGLSDNAGYFYSILVDLSAELAVDVSTLQRCIQFYQAYPDLEKVPPLTWSHYKLLLPMANAKRRKFYENLARKKNLNYRDFRSAVKNKRFEQSKESRRKAVGVQNFEPLRRPGEPTYLYKAIVDRVIDGDTILVKLDLGFQVWRDQRLRLAQIDAPAMDEPGGQEAYRYVRDRLAEVDFVMVKTNKIDIYGRYVGHVFYSSKIMEKEEVFLKGNYLNQELVERGLASIF